MTIHPTLRTLLRFDRGELPARRRRRTASHLEGCWECRARLTRNRAVREAAADVTAPEAPDVWEAIRGRVESGEALILPTGEESAGEGTRGRGPGRRAALAAGVVLLLAAGSAAAAVGVDPIVEWVRARVGAPVESTVPQPVAGIDVEVPAGGLNVELASVAPGTVISVERSDGALLQISGLGDAARARFRLAGDGVVVDQAPGGELRFVVPGGGGPVRIRAGATTLVVVEGGRIHRRGVGPVPELSVRLDELLRAAPRGEGP